MNLNVVVVAYALAVVFLFGALYRLGRDVAILLTAGAIVAHLGLLGYVRHKAQRREVELTRRPSAFEVVLQRYANASASGNQAQANRSESGSGPAPAPPGSISVPDITEEFTLFVDLLPESPWKTLIKQCPSSYATSNERLSVMERTLFTLILEVARESDPNPANALAPVPEKVQSARDMVAAIFVLRIRCLQKSTTSTLTDQLLYDPETKMITLKGTMRENVSALWSRTVAYFPTLPASLKTIDWSQPVSMSDYILCGVWDGRKDLETQANIPPTFYQCPPCTATCAMSYIPNPYKGNINAPHGTMPATPTAATPTAATPTAATPTAATPTAATPTAAPSR